MGQPWRPWEAPRYTDPHNPASEPSASSQGLVSPTLVGGKYSRAGVDKHLNKWIYIYCQVQALSESPNKPFHSKRCPLVLLFHLQSSLWWPDPLRAHWNKPMRRQSACNPHLWPAWHNHGLCLWVSIKIQRKQIKNITWLIFFFKLSCGTTNQIQIHVFSVKVLLAVKGALTIGGVLSAHKHMQIHLKYSSHRSRVPIGAQAQQRDMVPVAERDSVALCCEIHICVAMWVNWIPLRSA